MDELVALDKQLLLMLNGSDCIRLDAIMWQLSDTHSWFFIALMLIALLIQRGPWQRVLLFILCMALSITLADQISSSLIKPLVARWRPTHDPEIGTLVDIVRNYRGGNYGFVSSHAANVFAVAVFVSRVIRHRWLTICLSFWAVLVCYSRIYLGVHYLGDILFGGLLGFTCGWICFLFYRFVERKHIGQGKDFSLQYIRLFLFSFIITYLVIILIAFLRPHCIV